MTSTVAVMTDSAASLPADIARAWGIHVVPLHVIVDGADFVEGADITPDEVVRNLLEATSISTSQPSAGDFAAAFDAAASRGADAIVAVLISARLSGTVTAARAAAASASVPVVVVDSGTVAMAEGFAAIAAAALARTGADAAAVADEARRVAASTRCFFTVDTLEFLRRGGRVSPAVAAVGRALGVRPILEMRDGEVALVTRIRSTTRARIALLDMVERAIAEWARPAVAVMGVGGEYAADAARAVGERHPDLALLVESSVSATLSAHTGPGTLAVAVVDLPDRVH